LKIYCEEAEKVIDSELYCNEDCTYFDSCPEKVSITKINGKHSLKYTKESRFQALARAAQRARKLNKSNKDLYQKKISGSTGYFCPIFKVNNFQEVVDTLGLPIDPEKLFKASAHYLEQKKIWDANPSPRELKSAAEKICKNAKQLFTELENLSNKIYNALKSSSYDLDNLRIESHRVANFINDEFGRGDKLGNHPRDFYIMFLLQIYKEATGHSTITRSFLKLLDACLNIVE
jgi:hypothetical protein